MEQMVIVVLSDTHRQVGDGLRGRTAEAVIEAQQVLHAGDFTTEAVLSAIRKRAAEFDGVHGNRDTHAVTAALPAARQLSIGSVTIAMTHTRPGGETGLATWGRSEGADVVVFGHSHEPTITDTGDVLLINPGSHDEPRGGSPTHAELVIDCKMITARLCTVDGACLTEQTYELTD